MTASQYLAISGIMVLVCMAGYVVWLARKFPYMDVNSIKPKATAKPVRVGADMVFEYQLGEEVHLMASSLSVRGRVAGRSLVQHVDTIDHLEYLIRLADGRLMFDDGSNMYPITTECGNG